MKITITGKQYVTVHREGPRAMILDGATGETLYAGHNPPTIFITENGAVGTHDDVDINIVVSDNGSVSTHNDSRPTIAVQGSGSVRTFNKSRPTITVNDHGCVRTWMTSSPTITINDNGSVSAWDDSSPDITVNDVSGHVLNESRGTVTVTYTKEEK